MPPSVLPTLVPWLALLALLLRKSTRCLQAWGVWIPVCLISGLVAALRSAEPALPSDAIDFCGSIVLGLAFATAALWLIADKLAWRHRFLTFLVCAFGLAIGATAVVLLTIGIEGLQGAMMALSAGFAAVLVALALMFTGLLCRKKYGPGRITIWMVICSCVIAALMLTPIIVAAMLGAGSGPRVGEFFISVAVFGGACAVVVLPFLVLAFTNSLYRDRLKGLLHLGAQASAPSPAVARGEPTPELPIEFQAKP